MADTDYVEPLTGEEIIVDLCSQIAAKLRDDCNLRDADSYSNGYMAKVTVHLEAYSMDAATIEAEVTTGTAKPDPALSIKVEVDVPVELALDQVRERSEQPVPTLSMEEGQTPQVRKRRYIRAEAVAG